MSAPESPSTDEARADDPVPIMQAIQQLMEERKRIEAFAQESYARLSELRESIRAEYTGVPGQIEQLRGDLAEARGLNAQLEREARQGRGERDLLANELAQLKQQLAHQARQAGEFEELLIALVQEVGQREEAAHVQRVRFDAEAERLRAEIKTFEEREASLNDQLSKARETANKAVQGEQAEQGGGEMADMAAMIEQVEAEIREQQEALRKERQALANDRAELEKWRRSQVGAPPSSAGPTLSDPSMLIFDCKHCKRALQVKTWLAGLVTKCTHCGKMSPVPKTS